jgi:hypothetical protein
MVSSTRQTVAAKSFIKELKDAGIFVCLLCDKFSLANPILTLPIIQVGIISCKIFFFFGTLLQPVGLFLCSILFYLLWPEDAGIEPRTVAEFALTVRAADQWLHRIHQTACHPL